MYLGDNLLQQDLGDFVSARFQARRSPGPPRPAWARKGWRCPRRRSSGPTSRTPKRFGVAELDVAGRVLRLVEKPTVPPSDLALVGVYLFDSRIDEAVASIKPSGRGELEITNAIQWLNDPRSRGPVGDPRPGWWIDTGKLTPLLEANRLLLEAIEPPDRRRGRHRVPAGRAGHHRGPGRLVRSHVRGPCHSGRRIGDSSTASSGPSAPSARGAWSTIPRSSTPSWSARPG